MYVAETCEGVATDVFTTMSSFLSMCCKMKRISISTQTRLLYSARLSAVVRLSPHMHPHNNCYSVWTRTTRFDL